MGSTSTASGAGSSPVSACAAGVLLGIGCISIFAMGKLLQYVYEMGQRLSAAGGRGKLSAHNTSNPSLKIRDSPVGVFGSLILSLVWVNYAVVWMII
jgi:hypothetical protein